MLEEPSRLPKDRLSIPTTVILFRQFRFSSTFYAVAEIKLSPLILYHQTELAVRVSHKCLNETFVCRNAIQVAPHDS